MPTAAAAALVPEGEGPAELVSDGGMLVGGDVALGINNAGRKDVGPLQAEAVRGVRDRWPEGSVDEPLVPEGGFGTRGGVMEPEKVAGGGHLFLLSGDLEAGEVVRGSGAGG